MDVMVLSTETGACVGVLKFTEEGSAIYDPITQKKKYTVDGVDFDPALVLPKMTSAERTSSVLKDGELVYDVTEKQIFVGNGVTSGGIACNAVPDERMTAAESSISSHSSQLNLHSSQLSLLESQISSATFPVLSAGSMTALPAGSDPTLDVVQSGSAFYLNMGVPAGSDGQPPVIGAGSVTILPPGSESEFNLVYSSGAYFFDLAIPDGSLAQIQEYSSESAYAARDCITYSGGGYQVLEDTSAGENPENAASKFVCFAVAGVIGSDGITPIISGGSVTTLAPGESATATLTPGSGSEAHVYRLDLGLPPGSDGSNGSNGSDGSNGISPTVSVTQITSGAEIVTSDYLGTHSATILNGTNGSNGSNGSDGVSPTCSVTQVSSGAIVVTSDAQGEHSATILHGHLEGASEVVSALTSGAIVTTREAVPVALKTSAGNLYPLEKGTITISSGAWTIDPAAYLAYDNVSSFSGPWTVYFAGGVPDYMPIISGGGAVVPHENQAYKVTLSSGTAIAVNSAGLTSDICVTQELWLDMPSAAVPFTLQSFTWVDGAAPDFTSASTRYAITIRWNGTKFLANLAYTEDLA